MKKKKVKQISKITFYLFFSIFFKMKTISLKKYNYINYYFLKKLLKFKIIN